MLKSWKKFYHLRLSPFLFDVIDQIEENILLLAGRKKIESRKKKKMFTMKWNTQSCNQSINHNY